MIKQRFSSLRRLPQLKSAFVPNSLACALIVGVGMSLPKQAHAQTTPPSGYLQLAESSAPAPWGWVELKGYFFQTVSIPHAPTRRSINWWIIGDWDRGANDEYNGYHKGYVSYSSMWHDNNSSTDFFVPCFNNQQNGAPRYFWDPPIAVADYNPYTTAPSYFVQYSSDQDDPRIDGYYYPQVRLNFTAQGINYSFLAGPPITVSF